MDVAVLRVRDGCVAVEAETLLSLGRHPNLVRCLGVCRDGGDQLIVTEFAPQGSLSDLMEGLEEQHGTTIPSEHKVVMLRQVASGMCAVSELKLIHRDLAVRNILVCGFDPNDVMKTVCKVSDFGLTVNSYTATFR